MVESSPATRGARVRFPANAYFSCHLILITHLASSFFLMLISPCRNGTFFLYAQEVGVIYSHSLVLFLLCAVFLY